MARRPFKTLSEELLESAEQVANHFSAMGYTLRVEGTELGFPFTPALLCLRQRTKVVVEIDTAVRFERLREWTAYGRSAGQDFRVIVVVPVRSALTAEDESTLRSLGVGCITIADGQLTERLDAADLGLNVTLPEIAKLPKRSRELLGPAYEQFKRALWREGFETACQAFEAEVRRYLKRHKKRILMSARAGPTQINPSQVDRMTMGQLAQLFTRIQNQNADDALLGKTLRAVNKDRIGVAHHKGRRVTERRLRANVGRHMWSLVSGLQSALN